MIHHRRTRELWDRMRNTAPTKPDGKSWYSLRNASASAEILIYDEIGLWGITAKHFADELATVTAKELTVALNTPGGDVFDGLTIYNALARFSGTVHVRIDGLAASIGSLIAMAGKTITMQPGSLMMLHKPWAFTVGNADDLRNTAEVLDKAEESLVGIYAARTGRTADEVRDVLAADTWFNGEEAVAQGFATEAIAAQEPEPAPASASAQGSVQAREGVNESHSHRLRRLRLATAL